MAIQGIERLVQSTSFTTESSLPGRAQASPKLRQAAETFQYAIPLLDNIKDIPFTELSPEQRAVAREGRKLGLDYLAEGIKQFGSPKAAALVKSLNDLAEPLQVALDGIFHEIQIRRVNGKVEENKLTPLAIAKEVLENSGVRKEVSQIPGVDQLIQSIDSNVRGRGENISLLSSLAQVYTKPDTSENSTFEFSKSRKYAESLVGASINQGIGQPEETTDKEVTGGIITKEENPKNFANTESASPSPFQRKFPNQIKEFLNANPGIKQGVSTFLKEQFGSTEFKAQLALGTTQLIKAVKERGAADLQKFIAGIEPKAEPSVTTVTKSNES